MRKTLICPKCEGRKLWHIENVQELTEMGPKPIRVAFNQTLFRAKPLGFFEAFICAGCGYTEWYAHGIEEMRPSAKDGIHFIDNEPGAGLR